MSRRSWRRKMGGMNQSESVFFEDADAFESWLEANGGTTDELWIRMAKKSSGLRSLDFKDALDVALCFGWIDSQRRGIDETWFVQRFTPRRAKSNWSELNRRNVERLTAAGRMRPAGTAEVERAKQDGRW